MKDYKWASLLRTLAVFACLVVAAYSLGKVIFHRIDLYRTDKEIEALQEMKAEFQGNPQSLSEEASSIAAPSTEDAPDQAPAPVPPVKTGEEKKAEELQSIREFLTALQQKNEDTVAWLKVENTDIDYPVMHTPKNPEFYLHRNFEKKYAASGLPFLDGRNSPDSEFISPIDIIYAHNMKNGTMFGKLEDFIADKSYQKSAVILETMQGMRKYEVFAALYLNEYTPNADMVYGSLSAKTEKQFERYIGFVKRMSFLHSELTPKFGDSILILSTCSYHSARGRFAVFAVKRNPEDEIFGTDES